MRKSGKRLLVEGENDRLFFEACCQFAKLQGIQVGPPIALGQWHFTKSSAKVTTPISNATSSESSNLSLTQKKTT